MRLAGHVRNIEGVANKDWSIWNFQDHRPSLGGIFRDYSCYSCFLLPCHPAFLFCLSIFSLSFPSLLPSLRNDETEVQRRTFSSIIQQVSGRTRNQTQVFFWKNGADVKDHPPCLLDFSQCLLYFLPPVGGREGRQLRSLHTEASLSCTKV